MLTFNDVLSTAGIPPQDVHVILHSPKEKDFAQALPGLWQKRPDLLQTYQSVHSTPAEAVLKRQRKYVAVFVRIGRGEDSTSLLVFAGMNVNHGWAEKSGAELSASAHIQNLRAVFPDVYSDVNPRGARMYAAFDIRPTDELEALRGRLVISARLTPAYVRLAESLEAPIISIREAGAQTAPMPPWRNLTLPAVQIDILPREWETQLREWRGIYMILDQTDGARYVGTAYGDDNLLGRWREHCAGDHGVTRELAHRTPQNFIFSILERMSPDASAHEVTAREQSWMVRLHTKDWGLNT